LSQRSRWPRQLGQWLLLLAITVGVTAGLQGIELPAALLLGPMVGGIIMALAGADRLNMPRFPYILAQAVVGCLIARTASPSLLPTLAGNWPLFVGVTLSTLGLSTLLGWGLFRLGVLPATTGIWGVSPGGAMAMVVLADAYGDDARIVAFMQYLRMVCVAGTAALVAHFWVVLPVGSGGGTDWLPALYLPSFLPTLALIALGALVGRYSPIPSGAMLAPMLVGTVLRLWGDMDILLPPWLLVATYAALGWKIGLGFTPSVAVHASKALPSILASIVALMGFCGLLAWGLVELSGADALTAYLATSPGGMDSVAVIAAACPNVDLPYVMTFQTARFLLVVLLAPPLARFMAGKVAGTVGAATGRVVVEEAKIPPAAGRSSPRTP